MFGEEMDWSWRARTRGFRTVFLASPSVLHHGGASSPGLEGPMFARSLASRVDFLRRHRGGWQVAAGRLAIRLGVALRLAAWTVIAAAEGLRGPLSPRTRVQLERFRAAAAARGGAE
jgi:GT2 family glycosyltransferase